MLDATKSTWRGASKPEVKIVQAPKVEQHGQGRIVRLCLPPV
jgi:hypothetical protein